MTGDHDAAAAAAPDQPQPLTGAADRIASLDFIRGIAVLGILAANIVAFGQPMTAYMYPDAFTTPHGAAEDWMWVAQFVLIDGKMRGLFSLLFGASMMLIIERADAFLLKTQRLTNKHRQVEGACFWIFHQSFAQAINRYAVRTP